MLRDAVMSRVGGLGLLAAALLGPAAHADELGCRPHPIRWQDDCSDWSDRELTGLDRLRYVPMGGGGQAWLTVGGELRIQTETFSDSSFGLEAERRYAQVGRRLLANADLRHGDGWRLFGQLISVGEDGREPGPRAQDRDALDIQQLFIDASVRLGPVDLTLRLGRQEISLSGNRLISTRDGVVVRRAFQGVLVEARAAGARLTAFDLRPMEGAPGVLDDRPIDRESFHGLSLDLPQGKAGLTTLFLFDRDRPEAHYVGYDGHERRRTLGARWSRAAETWDAYAQGAYQWGEAGGQPVRASGGMAGVGFNWPGARALRLATGVAFASGDRRRGDGRIQTFDPVYPSNYGFSDAPLIYQTNYVTASAEGSVRVGRARIGAMAYALARYSDGDAIYQAARPLTATLDTGRPTAWLLQASGRIPLHRRVEFYGALVRGIAGRGIDRAGGHNVTYSRLQLTARF